MLHVLLQVCLMLLTNSIERPLSNHVLSSKLFYDYMLIDFYHAEFERDGDESNIEQVVKHRLDILKLRGLSNIQEIQEDIYEMLF